jgi:transcriptional regulator with XRE-family HTH domain
MDRKEFGKLIAALRQDMEWTQFNLAEYAGVDLAVISQIERGAKKHFEPDLLVKLANTFHLTTLERREFFFAATGISADKIVRQPSAALATDTQNADKTLAKMTQLVSQLRVPAFLLDVYSDVLAVNIMAAAFFQIPASMFETAATTPGGYNAMRVMFSKELATRSRITENWDGYALGTMRFFREVSLRYRARPYFQYLIKAFRNPAEYPLFDRYWKLVSSVEQDREANVDLFSYGHIEFGHLNYATATTVSLTLYGELLLNQYLPTDDHTSHIFEQLSAQCGQGVLRLAPWPQKTML